MFNAVCLMVFARGVGKAFGEWARRWFVMLMCTQFHIMYYASRTLPNMFAFGLSECLILPLNTVTNRQADEG